MYGGHVKGNNVQCKYLIAKRGNYIMDGFTISIIINVILILLVIILFNKVGQKNTLIFNYQKMMLIQDTCINLLTGEKLGAKMNINDTLFFTSGSINCGHLLNSSNVYWYINEVKQGLNYAENLVLMSSPYKKAMKDIIK